MQATTIWIAEYIPTSEEVGNVEIVTTSVVPLCVDEGYSQLFFFTHTGDFYVTLFMVIVRLATLNHHLPLDIMHKDGFMFVYGFR